MNENIRKLASIQNRGINYEICKISKNTDCKF